MESDNSNAAVNGRLALRLSRVTGATRRLSARPSDWYRDALVLRNPVPGKWARLCYTCSQKTVPS